MGKYLPWPIAIPLAIASHFVLDALPHYGIDHKTRDSKKFWKVFTISDTLLTAALAAWAIYYHHYAMFLSGLAAVMPDFVWVAHVLRNKSFDFSSYEHWFARWHAEIQRYEFPGGIWIEVPFAIILYYFVIWQTA